MARPNEPDMLPKCTKKGMIGYYSDLISTYARREGISDYLQIRVPK